jgi:hypothetical protein
MKKTLSLIVLVLVFALALSACGCKHETWTDANCETPKTCADCGETEGAPLGHSWAAATCETPKTCETCAKTEGEALGHAWVDADCENPKTCSNCKLTEGEALGHTWVDATTEAPKTCETCGLTEGERIVTDPRFTTAATAAVQGKWISTIEADGDAMGEPNFEGTISFSIVLELGNDGTMAMYIQLEDTSALNSYLMEAMYTEFEAQGLDRATADAAIKQQTGMSMEQYVDYLMSMLDFNALLGFVNVNGVYYVEDDMLYSGMNWDAQMTGEGIILEGDTLSLVTIEDGQETIVEFTRVTDGE